jgi:NIMA (never in mitosis gene a)-related kinase
MQSHFRPREKKKLGHNYTFVRNIGRGSFGEALLVKSHDGQHCVMKLIDITKLDSEQQVEAVNEVKVLSSLKHPYIVRYHESFLENGTLSIVMDYAESGDLAKRIRRHAQRQNFFAEEQVVRWFTQVALGLKYLHTRHVLHRDLKPQNIFVTAEDNLRLGDFGISKVIGSESLKDSSYIGTPYYFSPEICHEKLYSFASDIWALGCILYELAALRVPFEAQNIPSLAKKIMRQPVPLLPHSFSREVNHLCHDLLCRDHSQRPTASELIKRPMIQAEMRKMLLEAPFTPPSSAPSSEQNTPELRPSRPGTPSGTCNFANSELRRSPSAPNRLAPHSNMLFRTGSHALIPGNAGVKPAWQEEHPKDAGHGRDEGKALLPGAELLSHCARGNSSFLNLAQPRCGAARGPGRANRRRPAVPVWQGIH